MTVNSDIDDDSATKHGKFHMKTWLISEQGQHWSVKLDVRDLGGPLDTTCRAWGRTLVARVLAVLRVPYLWITAVSFAFWVQNTFRLLVPG